jgi:hypothetical protein
MTRVNRFQKCGLNLNETSDGGGSTELGIAKYDWAQLRTGAAYEGYPVMMITCARYKP